MSNINDTTTYPNTTPALNDHIPGTDVSDTGNSANGETVTFLLSAIRDLFEAGFVPTADVLPSADGTLDLGATATRWAQIYGDEIYTTGGLIIGETADHPITPAAGTGQLWIRNNATQEIVFTDDAGTDRDILTSASGSTLTDTAATTADSLPFFDNTDSDLPKQDTIGDILKLAPEHFIVEVETDAAELTTGTTKRSFRMPFAMTLTEVRASVVTAPTGSGVTVDINEGGTTILSTKLTIDATETSSETAATAAVISDSALADDALITIDIDAVGSTTPGNGLQVTFIGTRT